MTPAPAKLQLLVYKTKARHTVHQTKSGPGTLHNHFALHHHMQQLSQLQLASTCALAQWVKLLSLHHKYTLELTIQ